MRRYLWFIVFTRDVVAIYPAAYKVFGKYYLHWFTLATFLQIIAVVKQLKFDKIEEISLVWITDDATGHSIDALKIVQKIYE